MAELSLDIEGSPLQFSSAGNAASLRFTIASLWHLKVDQRSSGRFFHFFPLAISPKAPGSCFRLEVHRELNLMNVCSSCLLDD
jgi:hypothetical protein